MAERVDDGSNALAAPDLLRSYVDRIESLARKEADIKGDIKNVYKEAKDEGFDTPVLRRIIADRKKDKNAVSEFEAILDLYRQALGMSGGEEDEDEGGENADLV